MKKTDNVKGNALPLVLGILLLVAIGFGGWFYMKKSQQDDASTTVSEALENPVPAQVPSSEMTPQDQASTMQQPSETTPPAVVPTPAPTPETATTPAPGNVTIDVAKAMAVRSIGNPQAPIKIMEFASLTCSHCAHFQNDILPDMKSKYIDTGKVYLEYHDFPLNDPALKATLTARCLPADKFESFINLLFKTQEHWAGGIDYMAALKQNAKLAGMSDETFDACQADNKLKLAVADEMQKAQDKWKVDATPTFIINDGAERISGAQPLEEFERIFRKLSGDAVGEAPKVQ